MGVGISVAWRVMESEVVEDVCVCVRGVYGERMWESTILQMPGIQEEACVNCTQNQQWIIVTA